MMLTKSKIAMLLVSAAGALLVSHKHQQHHPMGQTHTLSAVTVTGTPLPPEPAIEQTVTGAGAKVDETPCVCPPPTDSLGQR